MHKGENDFGDVFGISESISYAPFEWWETYSSLDLYYSSYSSTIPNITLNKWETSAYFSTNHSWIMNKSKTLSAGANFILQFPTNGDLYATKQYNGLDVSMKLKALDKKVNFSISVSDVFGSLRPQNKEVTNNIIAEYNNYRDFRSLRFSIQYSLGNSKIKGRKQKFGNAEELKRTSN